MFDAVLADSTPPLLIVQEAATHEPAIFLSFLAVGSEGDMARLEQQAKKLKIPNGRATNDKNEAEVMVMFAPGSNFSEGLQLYRDALGGKLGKFRIEVVIITKEKAADGIDLENDPSVEGPAAIVIPGQ